MPKNIEELLRLTSEPELRRALRLSGVTVTDLEDIDSDLVFALRRRLDEEFDAQVKSLGIDDVLSTRYHLDNLADAVVFNIRQHRELMGADVQATTTTITSLLGDIDEIDETLDAVVDRVDQLRDNVTDLQLQEGRAHERRADLVVHVTTDNPAVAANATANLLFTLAEEVGDYVAGLPTVVGSTIEVPLTAVGATSEMVMSSSVGFTVLSTSLPVDGQIVAVRVARGATTTVGVPAGLDDIGVDDYDPEDEFEDEDDEDDEFNAPNNEPYTRQANLRLERLDNQPFTDRDLQGPLETALVALQAQYGHLDIVDGRAGETPSVRLVTLRGAITPTTMFKGTLTFPCGPVHATLTPTSI
jgi:hypothetical protein